ncbi:MAG TPA: hypothetical protein ENI73_02880, partial [Spirochaetes bacterium]|nr:hypothetical protein [Spirochaetota bacterium]
MGKKALIFVATLIVSFLSISLLTFSVYDPFLSIGDSEIEIVNWLGQPGAFIAHPIFTLFGQASYLIVLAMILIYLSFLIKTHRDKRFRRIMGFFLGIFALSYSIVVFTGDPSFKGGGVLAGIVHTLVTKGFGLFGELGFGLSLIVGSLYLIFDPPKTHLDQLYDKVLLLKKVFNDRLTGWTQGRGDRLPFIQKVSVPQTGNDSNHESPIPAKESSESVEKSIDEELENPVSVRHKTEKPSDPFPESEIIYLSPENESFITSNLVSEKKTEPALFDHKVQDACVDQVECPIDKPALQDISIELKGHVLTATLQNWKDLRDEEIKRQKCNELKKLNQLQELVEMTVYSPSLPSSITDTMFQTPINGFITLDLPHQRVEVQAVEPFADPINKSLESEYSPIPSLPQSSKQECYDSYEEPSINTLKPLPNLRIHPLTDSIVQSFMDSSAEQIGDQID